MTASDDCVGVICNGCGKEVFRILEGKCMKCLGEDRLEEGKLVELDSQLKELQKRYPGLVRRVPRKRFKR